MQIGGYSGRGAGETDLLLCCLFHEFQIKPATSWGLGASRVVLSQFPRLPFALSHRPAADDTFPRWWLYWLGYGLFTFYF